MPNAISNKDIGESTGPRITGAKALYDYGSDLAGVSTNILGSNTIIHLLEPATTALADTILTEMDFPSCTPSGLQVNTNVGTYIVDDTYITTAHATETKYLKMTIAINDSNGELEVLAFEKTTGEYGALPAGKTHVVDLKQFSLVALGTSLTEINDYIR